MLQNAFDVGKTKDSGQQSLKKDRRTLMGINVIEFYSGWNGPWNSFF